MEILIIFIWILCASVASTAFQDDKLPLGFRIIAIVLGPLFVSFAIGSCIKKYLYESKGV